LWPAYVLCFSPPEPPLSYPCRRPSLPPSTAPRFRPQRRKLGGQYGEHGVFHVGTVGQHIRLGALVPRRCSCCGSRPPPCRVKRSRPLLAWISSTHVALQQQLVEVQHEALPVSVAATPTSPWLSPSKPPWHKPNGRVRCPPQLGRPGGTHLASATARNC
jgi:hypothetical protein